MNPRDVVIVGACRTAIGKFLGQFKDVQARDLAICAGTEAIKRAGITPADCDEIVMGECFPGMQGSMPARQVSMRIGLAKESNACTVNQNCASGMRAMDIAANNILLGKSDISLVIGAESMTNAPYLLAKARMGYRMGDGKIYDSMLHDGLVDELSGGHMGLTAENVAEKYGITREDCDKIAVRSHNLACKAIDEGVFKKEIVPYVIKTKKGEKIVDTDEHPIRDCTMESIAKLKPAFKKGGVITAANASGINDAAAAVVMMSWEKCQELGAKPMAKLVTCQAKGVEPELMGLGPAAVMPKACEAAGIKFEDIDIFEVNEAFSAQVVGVERMLKEDYGLTVDWNKTNIYGSGIALGHPVGCTALRIIVTLVHTMEREDLKLGMASLCVGGGPALASIWSRDFS
jgi:acetyl-CoA C-acetyltransferase